MSEKKFEWLTEEICKEYLEKAKKLPPNNGIDTGAWRDLRIELQNRCNLPEVQAYNIIHGYHVNEYIKMYDILSGKVPKPETKKDKKNPDYDEMVERYEKRIADLESFQKNKFGSDYGFEEKDD